MLDAFVHPATLPELYSLCQGRRRTYLVELSTVSPPWKPNKRKKGATKTGSTFTPESRPGGVGEGGGGSRSVSRPGSIGGESDSSGGGGGLLDDNELGIYLEDVQKLLQSGKQDELSQSGTEEEEEVCRSIVLRLCFATMLRIGSGMREMIDGVDMSGRETPRSSARERRFSESEAEEVVVAVGHVLVSDIVRQQLGLRACSLARLRDVREEWRVPYGSKSPVLRLQRLGNQVCGPSPVFLPLFLTPLSLFSFLLPPLPPSFPPSLPPSLPTLSPCPLSLPPSPPSLHLYAMYISSTLFYPHLSPPPPLSLSPTSLSSQSRRWISLLHSRTGWKKQFDYQTLVPFWSTAKCYL